jgi:hypothetical protein
MKCVSELYSSAQLHFNVDCACEDKSLSAQSLSELRPWYKEQASSPRLWIEILKHFV